MRRKSAIAAILACILLLAVAGVRRFARPALNTWDIVNLPVEPTGPLLCFGDSLVAGFGASSSQAGYPARLGRLLGRPVVAIGTPGQTAAEGLKKLRADPRIRAPLVIVTLGGNDILKRIPLEKTVAALDEIFRELQRRGATVAFTGVESLLPGKRGAAYRRLCREHGVILIPDVLDGILGNDALLSDTVHPNDKGYGLMAERVAAVLRPFLT
jgi:lysophospholipase L1-like esterase